MIQLSYLTATFGLPLHSRDIPRWRSAWSAMAGFEHDLFHNHKPGDEGVIYRYPLVQYRVHEGKAALIALDEATDDVQRALSVGPWIINWNYKPLEISSEDLQLELYGTALDDQFYEYRDQYDHGLKLVCFTNTDWEQENYQRYKKKVKFVKEISYLGDAVRNALKKRKGGFNSSSVHHSPYRQ